jgi:hypothetical protein
MTKKLWFTSSLSTNMNGEDRPTFPGLYSCNLDEITGRCDDSETVVDSVYQNGERDRGLDLSNVILNDSETKLLALLTDTFWEILWAPIDEGGSNLFSYFRIPKMVSTDKSKGKNCEAYESRYAYYEVLPVAFFVDENDAVYISWEGFFQDCEDPFEVENGLVWSIGVSQVDPSCAMTDKIQSFDECTSPVSLFYRGLLGQDRRLGNGFGMSMSPANRRLFYLTTVNRGFDQGNKNELWIMPDGIHKRPNILATPNVPGISAYLATRIIPDVTTIRLSLDGNGLPQYICQTVYDKGVYCHSIEIDDDDVNINASGEPIFTVDENQVAESCTLAQSSYLDIETYMSPLTTGLEVLWAEDGSPELVMFGCFGRLQGRGNMTTVFRDGTMVQTMPGAYPGTILFGTNLPESAAFLGDTTAMPLIGDGSEEARSFVMPLGLTLGFLVFVLIVRIFYRRKRGQAYETKEVVDKTKEVSSVDSTLDPS